MMRWDEYCELARVSPAMAAVRRNRNLLEYDLGSADPKRAYEGRRRCDRDIEPEHEGLLLTGDNLGPLQNGLSAPKLKHSQTEEKDKQAKECPDSVNGLRVRHPALALHFFVTNLAATESGCKPRRNSSWPLRRRIVTYSIWL